MDIYGYSQVMLVSEELKRKPPDDEFNHTISFFLSLYSSIRVYKLTRSTNGRLIWKFDDIKVVLNEDVDATIAPLIKLKRPNKKAKFFYYKESDIVNFN